MKLVLDTNRGENYPGSKGYHQNVRIPNLLMYPLLKTFVCMPNIKDNNNFWFAPSFLTQLFLFSYIKMILVIKNSLKIPQRLLVSEVVNRTIRGQQKKRQKDNDQQNTTKKTKDSTTRTPQTSRVNSGAPEGWKVPAPLVVSVDWQTRW